MKKIALVLISLLIIGSVLTSCGSVKPFEFVQGGMTITLDSSFIRDVNIKGYSTAFQSSKATVYVLREKFDAKSQDESITLDADMTLEEYADIVFSVNGKEGLTVSSEGRHVYFVYEADHGDVPYTYHVCLYKTTDAFWMIQFVTPSESYEELKADIASWSGSVVFAQEEEKETAADTTDTTTVETTGNS